MRRQAAYKTKIAEKNYQQQQQNKQHEEKAIFVLPKL